MENQFIIILLQFIQIYLIFLKYFILEKIFTFINKFVVKILTNILQLQGFEIKMNLLEKESETKIRTTNLFN